MDQVDVLIVGAGLSGISAAVHLSKHCPSKSYAILEARESMGGTWDLFRYPGIRSDSDMYTLGYSFKPWTDPQAIADGPSILNYINETAKEYGIAEHIQYNSKAVAAEWSSEQSLWTVSIQAGGDDQAERKLQCRFMFMCSGYYNYDHGYTPDFNGLDDFNGQFVHPQQWNSEVDYKDKRVVVIGSGATAVTLVPELAKEATSVTMLQRSPTYMVAGPRQDAVANFLKSILPAQTAYNMIRWKNIKISALSYKACMKWPNTMRNIFVKGVRKELGEEYDIDTHFQPHYNPWEQRLCLVPEGELFEAIKNERADIVTDHIDHFTAEGIQLKSGNHLAADLVVCATGLELKLLGGITVRVNGSELHTSDLVCFRGAMFQDIPNMALAFGYTNASWTLKCDLVSEYVCRLLNHMDQINAKSCTPRLSDDTVEKLDFVDFSSGYFKRGLHMLPKQGSHGPWVVNQNYKKDIKSFRKSNLNEAELEYAYN
jgi:cation diffusion facilitator CzcD-associated flavoprotein CzcO